MQMPWIEGTCLHFTLGSCMYSRRNLLQQVKVPLQTKVVTYYRICEVVADVQYDIQTHEKDNSRSERLPSALQLRSLQYPHSPELLAFYPHGCFRAWGVGLGRVEAFLPVAFNTQEPLDGSSPRAFRWALLLVSCMEGVSKVGVIYSVAKYFHT